MSIAVVKYLNRVVPRALRLPLQNILRTSSNQPCQGKGGSEASSANDAQPSPAPTTSCPQPPPCPTMPFCPPSICPNVADPSDPCNYCPPPCIDPEYPDLTRLKKLQCHFQQDLLEAPVHLMGGKKDVFLYHSTILLILISLVCGFVSSCRIAKN